MLDNLLESYVKLQKEEERLADEKTNLKNQILEELDKLGVNKYSYDNITATVADRESFKYNDELAMIQWCKNNGYSALIKESVNTTAMNKELKKSNLLTESLNTYYTKTLSKSLTVKEA